MRATVPSSLQGGSLLDAHKWVKSKLARNNPGGTADYTLADSIGNPITLSDLVRNNPATIEVEIISGRGGVRNNPSLPLPTDFTPSADFVRGGNFSNQLLPRDLDPALVERMVAQEGIFGAVNTLTILLSKRSVADGISPATAGLLYAYSAVPRKNPSGKTPFLADAPKQMHDSEIMIRRYLDQEHGLDIEQQTDIIGDTKVSAKYGLTLASLEQFVKEVLAPFLAIASGNRGAIRTMNKLSAGFEGQEKKDFANNFGKLMYLMPTKAEDFYVGREYALIASTEFIYPILAQRLLKPKEIDTLLEVAKKFPNNLDQSGKTLKLSSKAQKLIKNRVGRQPIWKRALAKIPFLGDLAPSIAVRGGSMHSKAQLVKGQNVDDEQLIAFIVDSINLDRYRAAGLDAELPSRFIFMRDVGGFYPSPPRKWPPALIYSVMDAFLEALPQIVDIRSAGEDRLQSKVSLNLLGQMTDETNFLGKNPDEEYKSFTYKEFKDTLNKSDVVKKAFLVGLGVDGGTLDPVHTATPEGFIAFVFAEWEPEVYTIDSKAGLGISIIELLYNAMDIARSKYEYEPTNDDITFALLLIDFSIKTLFDEGATGTALTATLTSIFGRDRTKDARNRMKKLTDALTVKRKDIDLNNSEVFIAYLTGVSALMSQYVQMARADNAAGKGTAAALKKVTDFEGQLSSRIKTSAEMRALVQQVIDDSKNIITSL